MNLLKVCMISLVILTVALLVRGSGETGNEPYEESPPATFLEESSSQEVGRNPHFHAAGWMDAAAVPAGGTAAFSMGRKATSPCTDSHRLSILRI